MEKKNGIRDGFKELGTAKMLVLALQHVFAMFGATVLVPLLTGLPVSVTLFCAGIGTIWFYFVTKRKIPIFLGSSFAFLAAFGAVAPMIGDQPNTEMLPYATGGVVCAGLVYVLFALLIKIFGTKKIMKLFPPVVTGPIIVLIGLILAPSAIDNARTNWILAIIAIVIIVITNIYGKGMIKIVPILLGIAGSYVVGVIVGLIKPDLFGLSWVNLSTMAGQKAVAVPPFFLPKFDITSIITFVVVALAAMIEHIGDICAIGATTGENYIEDPGLVRTLIGDGVATSIAGCIGGPANTTYSENTGVVALTKVYDPKVMLLAAVITVVLSFINIFDAFINTIPAAIIGGISIVLYGMISATGLRTIVENKVNFMDMRNIVVAALILVCGLGFQTYPVMIGNIELKGLAMAAIVGVLVNALLPRNDYEFEENEAAEKAGAFRVQAPKIPAGIKTDDIKD